MWCSNLDRGFGAGCVDSDRGHDADRPDNEHRFDGEPKEESGNHNRRYDRYSCCKVFENVVGVLDNESDDDASESFESDDEPHKGRESLIKAFGGDSCSVFGPNAEGRAEACKGCELEVSHPNGVRPLLLGGRVFKNPFKVDSGEPRGEASAKNSEGSEEGII